MTAVSLVPRSAGFLTVLALAGCAASRSLDLAGPAPHQAIQILGATRSPSSARVTIALAAPARVTVFRVVPGEAVGLLRAPGDTAMEITPTLDAGRVMARTFSQSVPDRESALDNPYYRCPDRPAPTAAAAPLPAYVLVVTTSGAPDAARLVRDLGDLDLSGSISALSERVGAIVAPSAGEASRAFASAASQW